MVLSGLDACRAADVHYDGLNRRLDEWVPLDRFDLGSVSEDGKMTRHTKRKVDHEEHEEEGELDLATLKEHEEATKVKNITRIVLGQWMMETWYFSPFPKEYQRADVLYFCEFDLQFFARREQLQRYLKVRRLHLPWRVPRRGIVLRACLRRPA